MSAALRAVDTPSENKSDPASFEDFWTLYPKRIARKDALKAWERMSAPDQLAAVVSLIDWRRYWIGRGDERYTPHAATWLNAERWTDELPAEYRHRPASHAPVVERPDSPKTEMPQSVRDAIAKLRR